MERELVFGSKSFWAPDGRRVVKNAQLARLSCMSCPTEILGGEKESAVPK